MQRIYITLKYNYIAIEPMLFEVSVGLKLLVEFLQRRLVQVVQNYTIQMKVAV